MVNKVVKVARLVVSLNCYGLCGYDAKMMKINKYKKIKNSSLLTYYVLVVIRIVFVFVPQHGYIHPDEFFQSSELIAGEFLLPNPKSNPKLNN